MEKVKYTILVAEDEAGQRQLIRAILEKDFTVVTVANGEEARQLLSKRSFDLVITDERMPILTGSELIRWAREKTPETPIIVLTAFGSIQTAVEAIKLGAIDYLTKPLKSPDELRIVVSRALEQKILKNERLLQRAELDRNFSADDIIATSPVMKKSLELVQRVAPLTTTVLLTGESGTGKEVLARLVHRASARSDQPFVAVNCAALSETLLESELFGHEKGAFTGATQTRQGRFELAHGGTLFLDEIGELNLDLQTKLLRVLQEREFERVGGTRTITVDVRVFAGNNRELALAIKNGQFREDLYYRISVFPIHIPPLRERREDIVPLAEYFLKKLATRMGSAGRVLTVEARNALCSYDWPGNVRELQNAIERAVIISHSDQITLDELPLQIPRVVVGPEAKTMAEIEKSAILQALIANQGDRRKTAEQLQISLRTLQYRLKDYGLAGREPTAPPDR
ncbi:MAG: sigma-54-dependent Fis family transcriptional regulator [Acidobacteria bacterium]|nr:MAG: sigma-54-dependent Fis family transcriptional regulator [Acidobacteriota bacterium]